MPIYTSRYRNGDAQETIGPQELSARNFDSNFDHEVPGEISDRMMGVVNLIKPTHYVAFFDLVAACA